MQTNDISISVLWGKDMVLDMLDVITFYITGINLMLTRSLSCHCCTEIESMLSRLSIFNKSQ